MSYEMNELLELVVDQNASDFHLKVGKAPTLRISGRKIAGSHRDAREADRGRRNAAGSVIGNQL